jgi:polysaccharide export outer membrane protein
MRSALHLLLIVIAAATSGCASTSAPRLGDMPSATADLDTIMYSSFASQPLPDRAETVVPVAVEKLSPEAAFRDEAPYTLDSGDRVRVVVFGQDGLSNSYVVDTSGVITMPLIRTVRARGLTTGQLARAIADRLRKGFVREPHVAIEVETYRPFFILGEVTVPGQYAYVPHLTVENAVAVAGGFTPRAYRREITIDRPVQGGVFRQAVPPHTRVRAGDTIIVKERWF